MKNQPLIAIVGPTAVGKTKFSIALAKAINGELISCDSMQIYCHMDIGTAKATQQEQMEATHHLINICFPTEKFSVVDYQKLVYEKIKEISSREKLPILVGGTGLFYQAVVDGYEFPKEAKSLEMREKWENFYKDNGQERLIQELWKCDPIYAERIGVNDTKRALHALEVFDATGKPFSKTISKSDKNFLLIPIGLYCERKLLYDRINKRVEEMLKLGLIDELKNLRDLGLKRTDQSAQAIGYKQGYSYLDGEISYEEMIESIKKESRRYAKRQYTWFKKDSRIFWVNTSSGFADNYIIEFLIQYVKECLKQG